MSLPNKGIPGSNPTFLQIALVTISLSPVKILTSIPCWLRVVIALIALGLGTSKKPIYPNKTKLDSSSILKTVLSLAKSW